MNYVRSESAYWPVGLKFKIRLDQIKKKSTSKRDRDFYLSNLVLKHFISFHDVFLLKYFFNNTSIYSVFKYDDSEFDRNESVIKKFEWYWRVVLIYISISSILFY